MSARSRFLNLGLRLIAKRQLLRMREPSEARRSFARVTRYLLSAPPYSHYSSDHLSGPALWVTSGQVHRRRVIFYIHGGGFIVGSPTTHKAMLARLSRLTGIRVCAPQYRLAPENPFPAAFHDVRAAFLALLDRGYGPDDIIIGGDSAGGGMALALLGQLCRDGVAPRAAFAFSPWTDLTLSGQSLQENAGSDVLLPAVRIEELRQMYMNGADPQNAWASPLLAHFPDCPPVFMQVSDTEILRDDTLRMADHLTGQGAQASHDIWPDMPHVWQMFDGWIPEARQALVQTADFISDSFSEPSA